MSVKEYLPQLPFYEASPAALQESLEKYAIVQEIAAGTMLALEGDSCHHFFVVLSGSIRLYKPGISGREITLYHVRELESCVITAFCIMGQVPFPAYGIVEEACRLLLIPSDVVRLWSDRYDIWRDYLFRSLTLRLGEILETYDKALFQPLDGRIARYLLEHSQEDRPLLNITHSGIAAELGSSRVAVSRILERFMRDGLVELGRGKVTIKKRNQLLQLSRKTFF